MIIRIHPGSGVPIYLQIVHQVTHAIESGALQAGEQLPTIRTLAQDLVTNPNTVAKAYRELEYQGVIQLRQGIGAFVPPNAQPAPQTAALKHAHRFMAGALSNMRKLGLSEAAIRRVFEAALAQGLEAIAEPSHRR